MNILTPPTDSLYKFVAIVGLIIMAASLYWPINAVNNWGDKSLNFVQGKTNAQYDQRVLDSDKKYAAAGKPTPQQLHAFEIRQLNIDRQNAVLTPIGAPIIEYKMMFKYATQDSTCIFVFGLLLVIMGFGFWWNKVQLYQDIAAQFNPATGKRWDEEPPRKTKAAKVAIWRPSLGDLPREK